jgi:hypothetical protein
LVIRQPRADIQLLQLFELENKVLHPLSTSMEITLTQEASDALATPHVNPAFPDINGKVAQGVEGGLGVSILQKVIPGYSAGVEGAYSKAHSFEFRFLEVERHSIDIVQTEWALEDISDQAMRGSLRSAALQKRLFLVTSLLKSSNIGVKARGAGKADLNAELMADELVKAKLKYDRKQKDESEIIYQRATKLVFAIEARRLVFINSRFRILKIDDQAKVGLGAGGEDEGLLDFDRHGQLIKPLSVLDVSPKSRAL